MVDYSKFDNINDSDEEGAPPAPAAAPGGYSQEERDKLMADMMKKSQVESAAADPARSEVEKLKVREARTMTLRWFKSHS